jgi:hypothetical protein
MGRVKQEEEERKKIWGTTAKGLDLASVDVETVPPRFGHMTTLAFANINQFANKYVDTQF